MSTRVVRADDGVPFLIRVLWFFVIGWHATLYWIVAAWVLNLTIIGLALGLWMLNRVPLVLTLRMPRGYTVAHLQGAQVTGLHYQGVPQHSWPVRLLYTVLIGWWFSLVWAVVGWLLCVTIIFLPVGVWMLNRLPEVTTLMRQ
jgi:uncharacterized membrane protein YccF (DUF307 family)